MVKSCGILSVYSTSYVTGASACVPVIPETSCDPGLFVNDVGLCELCPAGSYCPDGLTAPIQCS